MILLARYYPFAAALTLHNYSVPAVCMRSFPIILLQRLDVEYLNEKKPLEQTPVETNHFFTVTAPQSGSEFDLTAFTLRFPRLAGRIINTLFHRVSSFFGVNGGIEPSLTESQSAVLPLHYEHRSGQ